MKTGIIFDVDGTLWDSTREVSELWDEVFSNHGITDRRITPETMMSIMGKTMDEIADILLPGMDPKLQRLYMDECEEREIDYLQIHNPVPYDGVVETVRKVAEDYPVFVVSNCQKGYIDLFLEISGLTDVVSDFLCYRDNNLPKDKNIRLIAERNGLEKYYYVGDIQGDYDSTVAAGGEFIFAAYGFGTVDADTPRIEKIEQLPELLLSLA